MDKKMMDAIAASAVIVAPERENVRKKRARRNAVSPAARLLKQQQEFNKKGGANG